MYAVITTGGMARDPSRWWYLLVPFPLLVGVQYLLEWLTRLLLPAAGPTRSEALPVLVLGIATALVGALVVVTAPLFVAGVILDVRALRNRTSWTPHWLYGVFAILPVLGIFVTWVALVSIPAAIGYLDRRRRKIGHPLGKGQSVDTDPPIAAGRSALHIPSSRWWYGVVVPPVLELSGVAVFWAVRTSGVLRQGSTPLTLLGPVALMLIAVGAVPLFAVSLYQDAKAVRDASADSGPDPRIWGVLGLGSIVGLVMFWTTFMPIIALAYGLCRRVAAGP